DPRVPLSSPAALPGIQASRETPPPAPCSTRNTLKFLSDRSRMSDLPKARAFFQPIVDVRAMRVVGFEALARFDDGGSPLDHLRVAEDRGQRAQLELQLIESAVD